MDNLGLVQCYINGYGSHSLILTSAKMLTCSPLLYQCLSDYLQSDNVFTILYVFESYSNTWPNIHCQQNFNITKIGIMKDRKLIKGENSLQTKMKVRSLTK